MQESAMPDKQNSHFGKKAKMPWILRLFLGIGALIQLLTKYIWRLSRKNVPLALGLALFAIIFAIVTYNAFFRQSSISRPILFSTRADKFAVPGPGGEQNRPFVAKAISTEALTNDKGDKAAPAAISPKRQRQPRDSIADFITAQEKSSAPGIAGRKRHW
ncbi:MAG: hypothetical protein DU429_03680 [Candidatus Tokpelaia sp.]|nr:MAG: hypothetical protein DU430_01545 [Candidatus Tokpelaia sp.]KAA6207200.1 MAG: hypothetical protein DU429_03680 [Candidatus Tokpelaia sp.]